MGLLVLELFAGTRSIGKAFEARGHKVYSIDWDKEFTDIDWHTDIGKITAEDIITRIGRPDVIWASPDCTSYSVAAIQRHRRKNYDTGELDPLSDYAKECDATNKHLVELIKELNPLYWFIENPRGGLRKMLFMDGLPRYTVTYCQYGDKRMKPTDIWTNHPRPNFKPPCRNGASCHETSPRGKTIREQRLKGIWLDVQGTTALNNARDRAVIPPELCEHIVNICEGNIPALDQVSIWDLEELKV